jgi:hypothetical protein
MEACLCPDGRVPVHTSAALPRGRVPAAQTGPAMRHEALALALGRSAPCTWLSFVAYLGEDALALSVDDVRGEGVGGEHGHSAHNGTGRDGTGGGSGRVLTAAVTVLGVADGESSAVGT